ncbi:MAG: hypothetical protein JKY18_04190 [Flavobacteriales bacterium]|nr:hypothetical protein [Flavobacteriales bacterium]
MQVALLPIVGSAVLDWTTALSQAVGAAPAVVGPPAVVHQLVAVAQSVPPPLVLQYNVAVPVIVTVILGEKTLLQLPPETLSL